jgi:hypothetical protein
MKTYTVKEILKRYNEGDWYGGVPVPFAGRYPTRIAFHINYLFNGRNFETKFEYIGKPSPSAIRAFAKASKRNCYRVDVVEFDRQHVIAGFTYVGAYGTRLERNGWRLPINYKKTVLWRAYYPWDAHRAMLYMYMQPWWSKRISGLPCYSPYATLSVFDHIAPHRDWLKAKGLLREQRTKTATA